MKKIPNKRLFLGVLILLGGCAKNYTVTDSVSLYPANASAQQLGVINFYSQYQSNRLPNQIPISLPNGQMLNGQMTYVSESGSSAKDNNSIWDNVRVGIGIGQQIGRGSLGVGLSSPTHRRYHSDKQAISINAYGAELSMNCQGQFNRSQKTGTLTCQLTNGMQYRGTIRRILSPAVTPQS